MPTKSSPKVRTVASRTWRAGLRAQYQRLVDRGAKRAVLVAADVPRQTAHRITGESSRVNPDEESGESGESVSWDAMERLRIAINDALPDANLPPPFVAVDDLADYSWIDAGRRLRAASPETFVALLEQVERRAGLAEADRHADELIRNELAKSAQKSTKPVRP